MPEEEKKGSQASTEGPKEKTVEEILYPGSGEDGKETAEEKETRETKEVEEKTTKELNTRAKEVGLEEGATEEEVKTAEDKKVADEKKIADDKAKEKNKPSVSELHDAAIAATEKWQADPTPENKKAAQDAVAETKKAIEDNKKSEIKYDVKLPEGSLLPEDATEKIVTKAREQGFSNEVAQSMVDTANDAVMEKVAQAAKDVEEMVNVTWPKDAADDKEIGGDDFGKNAELSKRVLLKYAPTEFVNLLDPKTKENPTGTGYGNNPHFMKFLVRLGKTMSDDQLLLPKGKGPEKKSMADMFYGKDNEKKE